MQIDTYKLFIIHISKLAYFLVNLGSTQIENQRSSTETDNKRER